MLPARFVFVDAFPLTPNGKIDRRALPAPDKPGAAEDAVYLPPRSPLEEEVAALVAGVLGLERVSMDAGFFDLGGSSLLATRLIFQAREQFAVQIPLRQLFMEPTAAGLSAAVEKARLNGTSSTAHESPLGKPQPGASGNGHDTSHAPLFPAMALEALQAEVQLDPAIPAPGLAMARVEDPEQVLLTGATGFVGAFLLRDLLRMTGATVTCLVRAADADTGLARLQQNMAAYGLWDEAFERRLVALPGDLGRPLLGLSAARFDDLARTIDLIYHNGAMVNFVYAYAQHKAANVLSTHEILRLAGQERLKAVHFVSTLSVFHGGGHDDGTLFREDADLDGIGVPFGGYAQSKWVAEKLILAARERGMPVAIYRPGLVSGAADGGAWNTADMMSTMAQACLALGMVPDLDLQVDLVPVDYVSRAIVTLSLGGQPQGIVPTGGIFNLANPRPLPYAALLDFLRDKGLSLQVVPFAQWRDLLVKMAVQFGGERWHPFLPLVDEVTAEQIFMPSFNCSNTLTGLAGSGVVCPAVGPELLQTYLSFFQRAGAARDLVG
jgi:thioester reductase-like protein